MNYAQLFMYIKYIVYLCSKLDNNNHMIMHMYARLWKLLENLHTWYCESVLATVTNDNMSWFVDSWLSHFYNCSYLYFWHCSSQYQALSSDLVLLHQVSAQGHVWSQPDPEYLLLFPHFNKFTFNQGQMLFHIIFIVLC